jgi:hypothetical protein
MDPIGIAYTPDEYQPEVGLLLPRLAGADSVEQVEAIVREVFTIMFNAEMVSARSSWARIAAELLPIAREIATPEPPR